MKKSRFTEEQIIGALQQLDGGISARNVARDLGVNVQTLYRWRKKFDGMDVSDARRLKHASRLSEEARAQRADIPWSEIVSLRNRLSHGYDSVDLDILWSILRTDLPELIRALESDADPSS